MATPASRASVDQLIGLARWAPSGDNTQPWRFDVLAPDRLVLRAQDTRDHCVYDLDGRPSQLAVGALIETLHLAAGAQGQRLEVTRRHETPDTHPTFDLRLFDAPLLVRDPLVDMVPVRSVHRRPLNTRAIDASAVKSLTNCLPVGYTIKWFDTLSTRWQLACLMFRNAKLRLTMREAYEVHRSVIDWGKRFSEDRVPDQALGVDAITLKLMRWAMLDWKRISFMNRWLAGTWAPRAQMDLLPALLCGAHVAIVREAVPVGVDDHIDAGRAVQRFWLTATALGIQHQPEMTPLIFSRYVREGRQFSCSRAALALGKDLAARTLDVLGSDLPRVVWLGRLGYGQAATARSLRRPVAALCGNTPVGPD